jgi:uncharacterized protein (TIGR03437 family)
MRLVWVFAGITILAWAISAQELPQSVDLVQRIDDRYPWLAVGSLAVDSQANLYVSSDIQSPLPDVITNRIGPLGPPNNTFKYNIVIVKLDPTGQHILYATAIGGSGANYTGPMQIDTAGNLYMAGSTTSDDFPATSIVGSTHGGVVLKLDPNGDLVYSMVLGWASLYITGAEVDATGAVYVSGGVKPGEVPTSTSAYNPSPLNPAPDMEGFIVKLDPSGTKLEAATYLGDPGIAVNAMKLRRNGDVVFSTRDRIGVLNASLSSLEFSTPSSNTLHLQLDGADNIYAAGTFALKKYSPDGQRVLFSLDFQNPGVFESFTVARSGMLYLVLMQVPPNFPTRNGTQPCTANLPAPASSPLEDSVLMVISPEGDVRYATHISAAILMTLSPANDHPYAIAIVQAIVPSPPVAIPLWIAIVHLNPDELPSDHVSTGCLVHSGSLGLSSAAPGTIMTIFGDGLGPDNGQSFTVKDGLVSFNVAGTSVTVDGQPAAVLYAQRGQINFVVPWSLRTDGARVPICVGVGSDKSCLYAATDAIAPGLFSVNSQTAAINEDGSVNSPSHPTHYGSYISVYLTGLGHIQGPEIDGGVAALPIQPAMATVSAVMTLCDPGFSGSNAGISPAFSGGPTCVIHAQNAAILFAGAVPTLTNGVAVVIMRVPSFTFLTPQLTPLTLQIQASPDRPPVTVSGTIYIEP